MLGRPVAQVKQQLVAMAGARSLIAAWAEEDGVQAHCVREEFGDKRVIDVGVDLVAAKNPRPRTLRSQEYRGRTISWPARRAAARLAARVDPRAGAALAELADLAAPSAGAAGPLSSTVRQRRRELGEVTS